MTANNQVFVPWEGQDGIWWAETCAQVIEVFGLPGDRFESKPDVNYISFTFKNEKDAELCRILLSERI